MQAKPERLTPINAGAYDGYNVMMKYIKKIKINKLLKIINTKTPTQKQQQQAHNALLHHHQLLCLRTAKSKSKHHSVTPLHRSQIHKPHKTAP